MKIHLVLMMLVISLVGCVSGGVDFRFSGIPSESITIDGYPIDVTVLKVSDTVFDVQAGEGRAIAFTGLNEPLLMYDRFRRGATKKLRYLVGESTKIRTVSEVTPTGIHKMFIRYEILP